MGLTGNLALKPIFTLSGGQKSRVAFALCTYAKPQILILDEPTNHLDLDTVQVETTKQPHHCPLLVFIILAMTPIVVSFPTIFFPPSLVASAFLLL